MFGAAAAGLAEPQPMVVTAESPTAGSNPLAGLLGYDDGDDEELGSPRAATGPADGRAKPVPGARPVPAEGPQAAAASVAASPEAKDKDLDAEVRGK